MKLTRKLVVVVLLAVVCPQGLIDAATSSAAVADSPSCAACHARLTALLIGPCAKHMVTKYYTIGEYGTDASCADCLAKQASLCTSGCSKHQITPKPSYTCHLCGSTFTSSRALIRHKRHKSCRTKVRWLAKETKVQGFAATALKKPRTSSVVEGIATVPHDDFTDALWSPIARDGASVAVAADEELAAMLDALFDA